MITNPETLKYKLNQRVKWADKFGLVHEGLVANVCFEGLEVIKDNDCKMEVESDPDYTYFVEFQNII
jgi:hypothetical protein